MAEGPGSISTYIYVEGITDALKHTSLEELKWYMESKSGKEPDEDILVDGCICLIKFTPPIEYPAFIEKVQKKPYKEGTVRFTEVKPPCELVASSNNDVEVKNISAFLQNVKNGGGQLVSKEPRNTPNGGYIFKFKEAAVVHRICNHGSKPGHITVKCVDVRISPYFSCNRGDTCIWDKQLHIITLPDPVSLEYPQHWIKFFSKCVAQEMEGLCKDNDGEISFCQTEIRVTCTLGPGMKKFHSLAKNWPAKVKSAVEKYVKNKVTEIKLQVQVDVWQKMDEFVLNYSNKSVLVNPDPSTGCFLIVGKPSEVKTVQENLKRKSQEIFKLVKANKQNKSFQPEKLRVLTQEGIIEKIRKKFEQEVKILVVKETVSVEGCQDEVIDQVMIEISAECNKLADHDIDHEKSREWVDFANSPEGQEYIRSEVQKKGLDGEWNIDGESMTVYRGKGKKCDHLCMAILDCIVEERFDVQEKDGKMFQKQDWHILHSQLTAGGSVNIVLTGSRSHGVLLVVGTSSAVSDAKVYVRKYIEEHDVVSKSVQCSAEQMVFVLRFWIPDEVTGLENKFKVRIQIRDSDNFVRITGGQTSVDVALTEVSRRVIQIRRRDHKIKEPDIHTVISREKNKGTLKKIEKDNHCLIQLPRELETSVAQGCAVLPPAAKGQRTADRSDRDRTTGSGPVRTKGGKLIQIEYGEIGKQKGDILVCSTSNKGNLKSGNAGKSLVTNGGDSLQLDVESQYPQGIQNGKVAVIGPGNLKCTKVYLTALPKCSDDSTGETMSKFILKCLEMANKHEKKSIVFSAMGSSSYMGYPCDLIAQLMYKAVFDFDSKYQRSWISRVTFTIHHSDAELVKAFQKEERLRQMPGISSSNPLGCYAGSIKIETVIGDLDKEKSHVLVSSVSSNLKLSNSGICNTLLKVGGQSLQDECDNNYGNEILPGKVIAIGGGNLKCKKVYLTNLPGHSRTSGASHVLVSSVSSNLKLSNSGICNTLLKVGGQSLQDECDNNYGNEILPGKVIAIGGGNLKCKKVYLTNLPGHSRTSGAVLQTIIQKILDMARAEKFDSVSIPALGMGYLKYPPRETAEIMYQTVMDWALKNPRTSLRTVRFVLYHKDTEVIQAFRQAHVHTEGHIGRIRRSFVIQERHLSSEDLETWRKIKTDTGHVTLTLLSDTETRFDTAITDLQNTVSKSYIRNTLKEHQATLKDMSLQDVDQVRKGAEMHNVEVTYNGAQGWMEVYGTKENVDSAKTEIQKRMRNVEKRNMDKAKAEVLVKQVKWHFREVTPTEVKDIGYDTTTNFYLEESYKAGKKTHEIQDEKGDIYVVDFQSNEEYLNSDRSNVVAVIRKDILKAIKTVQIPSCWTSMKPTQNVLRVSLPSSSPEYQNVEQQFLKEITTGPYSAKCSKNPQVLEILRIQNQSLYSQFVARKKEVEKQKASLLKKLPCTRQAWHGTKPEVIDSVIDNGFNRSYSGNNAGEPYFGNGSYFARCASYSGQQYLAGSQQTRYMFRVKVITGVYCQGTKGMRFLTAIPNNPSLLFDCAVNEMSNPMEFVTFHDTQAYPEYLVKYQG